MLKITATRAITWPELSLRKGENEFPSRKSVPAELWPKLDRFRKLKLVNFEGDPSAKDDEPVKLEELTERQIYDMGKADLAELAKANGIGLAADASKKTLVDALVAKLPKPPASVAAADAAPATEPDAGKKAQAKGGKGPSTSPDVQG